MNKPGIPSFRKHKPHINPSQCCCLQSGHHFLVRQEIRSLHIKIPPGRTDSHHQSLHNIPPLTYRIGSHNLPQHTSLHRNRREIFCWSEQGAINGIPVSKKSRLQPVHHLSSQSDVCISPISFSQSLHITFCQIHPTYEPHTTIYHHNLPMVAIIHFTGKSRETDFQERKDFYAFTKHLFIKIMRHFPTTHIVIQHPYLHSVTSPVNQSISNQPTYRIILKNIKLQMDVMTSSVNIFQ